MTTRHLARRTARTLTAMALGVAVLHGCSGEILDVTDPDIIDPDDLTTPSAAQALRAGVTRRLTLATSGGADDATFVFGGLLADEWKSGDTFEQRNTADQRVAIPENSFLPVIYRSLTRVRTEGQLAIEKTEDNDPTAPTSEIGKMYTSMAFAVNLIGETFCNGTPLSSISGTAVVYGNPIRNDSTFKIAVAEANLALANVGGADGPKVANFAAVVKGRALLNLGRFDEAAAAVANVPTSFTWQIFHTLNTTDNQNWTLNTSNKRYVLADNEGTNGLPFRSAADPRIKSTASGTAFDTFTPFVAQINYDRSAPVTIASGIEARLIEAEAALRAGNTTVWLAKLNGARASGLIAGLAPLTDPGVPEARVNLTFRERAFWMFGTGHRLGDLRRLVRQYNRGAETVFPSAAFHKGGTYGNAVNFPVPFDEENNPNFVGCLDRNP